MSAAPASGSKVLCKYFVSGMCRNGSGCRFSHDLAAGRPSAACKYYQLGSCSYGAACRYDHVKAKGLQLQTATLVAVTPSTAATVAASSSSPASRSSGKTTTTAGAARKLTPLHKGKDYGAVAAAGLAQERTPSQPRQPSSSADKEDPSEVSAGTGCLSYADAARRAVPEVQDDRKKCDLCPLAETGHCSEPESCGYVHGLVCDMCNLAVLHPDDERQRHEHHEACLAAHERSMERAFAAQRSADKQCCVCMETVMTKERPSDRRFGVLSSCLHVFCLGCVRTWRLGEDDRLDTSVVRSCPTCRVPSHFVVPSEFCIETQDEKDKLIADYKSALKRKHCRYFARGAGECPFSTSCFYLHAYPDGREAPAVFSVPRRRFNDAAELERVDRVTLWDFLYSAATGGGEGEADEVAAEDAATDGDVSAEPSASAESAADTAAGPRQSERVRAGSE